MIELLTTPGYPLWAVILAGIAGAVLGRAGASRPASGSNIPETELLMRVTRLAPETRTNVARLVKEGRMIEAVRDVRRELGCGLKEAKDVVDRISSGPSQR
ncbi:MAG: hypothetical protein KGP27_16730 [Hyphomicrobiales bacterium]|nr:hypothetical protein [Hyphomicrobiales bacterium]NDC60126.1 hypothetical protein [Alphaproteobacteria bacterium]